jgi:hypothetical protein
MARGDRVRLSRDRIEVPAATRAAVHTVPAMPGLLSTAGQSRGHAHESGQAARRRRACRGSRGRSRESHDLIVASLPLEKSVLATVPP